MTKSTILTLLLFSVTLVTAQVKNYESEGNLESTASLKEMKESGVKNHHTPADILRLVSDKIENEKYKEAAADYMVAMAYGFFDIGRVADVSAHQAIVVLRMNTFATLTEEQIDKLQTAVHEVMAEKEGLISMLKEVGKPNYFPKYMIQHGIGAFQEKKTADGLIPDFVADAQWEEVLSELTK